MATTGPIGLAARVIGGAIELPINAIKYTAAEPTVTGSLLFALTRAPIEYRQRLLNLLHNSGLSAGHIERLIKTLRYLLIIGVLKRVNQALNRLALNNWSLRKLGAPFDFDGSRKTELVVVTGGCSGFGYEMVKAFSKHAKVVIIDISPVPAELKKLPGVYYYQLDVTDFAAIESTAETIRREHGDPTVLINNAGIANGTYIMDSTAKGIDRIFKVNIASHFILIKEFLPGMLKAKKGHIVTIASMASFVAGPGLVDYCCTKVAALYLNDGLRNELITKYPNGNCIQTTSVHPSWHSTGIVKPYEDKLASIGIRTDPASNVSSAVVEQVLAARSGRIFMPRSEEAKTGVRGWPVWLQDTVFSIQTRIFGSVF
ncbi:uncharacterized protein A1O9_10051 [Exophiala aquamarina CBS 119918]|uniref:Uncharacterized protein n=1 Tax=Exophiala aquamarina CBS 119918 TaxID=1182545 RepID=A0A072P1E4_9EURO|nr:uncharacterized protein A1O9_10051 [Exophiala aquamarina CBS 119918]KEF53651.1 hypothetical protein A1O9_10051 [Exophiala aquamarina CBS 119918]